MTARKLYNTNPGDRLIVSHYLACAEVVHMKTSALDPNECAGYTAASLIPHLNGTDWGVVCMAVNAAVEKAAREASNPESVLLFEIPDYVGGAHLAIIELRGYVPTSLAKKQGRWTSVRATLFRLNGVHEG